MLEDRRFHLVFKTLTETQHSWNVSTHKDAVETKVVDVKVSYSWYDPSRPLKCPHLVAAAAVCDDFDSGLHFQVNAVITHVDDTCSVLFFAPHVMTQLVQGFPLSSVRISREPGLGLLKKRSMFLIFSQSKKIDFVGATFELKYIKCLILMIL